MTNMTNTEYAQPQARSFTEHMVFVALLLPTFIVLAAAFVSLAQPDPAVDIQQQPMLTAVACPCTGQEGVEGP